MLYFAVPTTVGLTPDTNLPKKGFVIPLSERLLREGTLQEGFYIETATDPEVNSETAAIVFVPK